MSLLALVRVSHGIEHYTMNAILRKIRMSLINSDQSKKYLLYGLGEITLVVIGILIALQINNWNQDRIERNTELEILKGMQNTLRSDLIDLERHMRYNAISNRSTQIILEHLERDLPYHDSLSVHFALTTMLYWTPLNPSVFETLNAQEVSLTRRDDCFRDT